MDAIEDLTVLNGKNVQFLSEDPTVKDECLRLMEELQEVKLSNERKISELRQLYSKPVWPNRWRQLHFMFEIRANSKVQFCNL